MPRVLSNRGREMTLMLTGVDFSATVTILDEDSQPVDIEDATFVAQIRRFAGDSGEPLAEFEVDIADADAGTATIELSAEDAAGLSFDRAKWALQMTLDGVVTQPYYGDVYFTPSAVR